jgi:hypothetical protein
VATLFMLLAAATQAWLMYSARTNLADSGEGSALLLLLAMPWPQLVPDALWDSPAAGRFGPFLCWAMIVLNALLLYCIAGGLRWRARRP